MTGVITWVVDCGDGVCIGGKHLLTTNYSAPITHRTMTNAMSRLIKSLQKGLLGGFTATALVHGVAIAHPGPGPHPLVLQTKSATFLRDCGFKTPASVQSVSRECRNIEQGLVGTGSSVEILHTVDRKSSGLRGIWHEVRIVHNRASGTASVNAHGGIIGWMRAGAF